tara:strand:+ start:1470 stop:1703 length:234 start_codon:yes stop_codon:yes gene_type:complete
MKIYICDDDGAEITWVIKSKHLKAFLKENDWLNETNLRSYKVNNLQQICIAVMCGAGMYTGDIYDPAIGRSDLWLEN